jgi:hypothetical protein
VPDAPSVSPDLVMFHVSESRYNLSKVFHFEAYGPIKPVAGALNTGSINGGEFLD